MARPPNKTGTSKFILALGTVAAVAVLGGALYQAQKLSEEEERSMMAVIPEQVITEAVIETPEVPEANIPEPETEITTQPEADTTPASARALASGMALDAWLRLSNAAVIAPTEN